MENQTLLDQSGGSGPSSLYGALSVGIRGVEQVNNDGGGTFSMSHTHSRTLPLGLDSGCTAKHTILLPDNGDGASGDLHCHRSRGSTVDHNARRKLIIASILCLAFMLGEIVGGWLSNSLAIATDAAHLLTDFASFMISLFSLWVSARPATRRMSFGWYRAEVLGALTSVLLIWVVTAVLVYLAVLRVIYQDYEIDSTIMLITSAVGVAVNLVMGLTLHQHGHSHGGPSSSSHLVEVHDLETEEESQGLLEGSKDNHAHSHGHSHKDPNINVRAAFIHVIGDLIQSLGVFTAAIVIYYKPEWRLVDPICTFLFSVLVLLTTVAILRDTMHVLMEATPRGFDFGEVLHTMMSCSGVLRVHNLRVWALSLDKVALAAHLVVEPNAAPDKVLRAAETKLRSRFSFFEMTLQVEPFELSMEACDQCKCPEE